MAAATWPVLGPTTTLADIDLSTLETERVEADASIAIARPGVVDAILLTFRARLTETLTLEGPPWPDRPSSWDTSVWFLPEAIAVREGDRLEVDYRFGGLRSADGLSCHLAGR